MINCIFLSFSFSVIENQLNVKCEQLSQDFVFKRSSGATALKLLKKEYVKKNSIIILNINLKLIL